MTPDVERPDSVAWAFDTDERAALLTESERELRDYALALEAQLQRAEEGLEVAREVVRRSKKWARPGELPFPIAMSIAKLEDRLAALPDSEEAK